MKDTIRNWLTEQFGDDAALHDELYAQYAADMKTHMTDVQAALAAHDTQSIGAQAHAMKGMALQMGDRESADICLALQKAGQGNVWDACQPLVPQLARLVAAL